MAMSKAKAEKAAARAARQKARDEAKAEVVTAKGRVALAYGLTYVASQILPTFIPAIAEQQTLIDGGLAVGGGYMAYTNDDAAGDYALGVALVGAIQTLDRIGARLQTWIQSRQAA